VHRSGSDDQFHAVGGEPAQCVLDRAVVGVGVDGFGDQHDGAGGELQQPGFGGVGVAGGDAGALAGVVGDAAGAEGGGNRVGGGEVLGEVREAAVVDP